MNCLPNLNFLVGRKVAVKLHSGAEYYGVFSIDGGTYVVVAGKSVYVINKSLIENVYWYCGENYRRGYYV
ncbi:MAG: hypothetical protein QXE51_03260 [Nitrososphaeria archaeon]